MSRSYKKIPYAGDRKTKWAKRQANRKFRNYLRRYNIQDEFSFSAYKRITTWKEHLAWRKKWLARGSKPYGMILFEDGDFDIDREYQLWSKWYKRK